jgi:hypothetical protein
MKKIDYIIEQSLKRLLEQEPAADASAKKKETDNAPMDADVSPFTPAEEKFLGKFDAYGTTHLGIIYSPSDIGVREFMSRAGNDLNLTPGILLNLIRNKIIKIVPYTGYGLNTDYTLELQLSLDDVKGLGKDDKEKAEAGSSAGGAAAGGAPPAPGPGMETAGYIPNGTNMLSESVITEHLMFLTETTTNSQAKQYLINKYPDIQKQIEFAESFWNTIFTTSNLSGFDWDEDSFVSTIETLFGSNGREQAILVDALGMILMMSNKEDQYAVQFLTDFVDIEYEVTLDIDELGRLMSPQLVSIINTETIDYIIEELEPAKLQKFLNGMNTSGIGKIVMPRELIYKSHFYPAYSKTEVMSLVLKWLAPYKAKITYDPKTGHSSIKNVKSATFYDTLSPEQRQQRAKYAIKQINSNIRKYFSSAAKAVAKNTVPTIQEMPGFAGAWVDKNGIGYVYIKHSGGKVSRLYPDGKYVLISSKGKVERTAKWEINYSKSTGKFSVSNKM